jgi:hypothetical protein
VSETASALVINGESLTDNKLAFRKEQVKLLFGQLNLIYLACSRWHVLILSINF